MLYRTTHHPFFFSPTPFTSITLSPNLPSSSPSPLQVVEQEMEPVHRTLEGELKPVETSAFSPPVMDDLSAAVNGQTSDDFFVDDLLDFSHVMTDEPEEKKQQKNSDRNEVADLKTVISNVRCTTNSPLNQDFCSLPASELAVPADDLENLEWLSHFVEDSFSEYTLTCPATKLPPEAKKAMSGPEETSDGVTKPVFTTLVHTKARTKRSRTGLRVWPLASPSITESSASASSSSSSSTTSSPFVGHSDSSQDQFSESLLGKPPVKKQKKEPPAPDFALRGGEQPRRCSHCGVQKTPQWRAGPLGAKTLCNACGVRFKSGRLLPEYRPACSPTFSSDLHSNNHRKVLEMRQKKEIETGLVQSVQSF